MDPVERFLICTLRAAKPRSANPRFPSASMTDHIAEIAEHERSTRRWMLPFAIVVIALVVAFIVLLARPDL